MEDQNIGKHCEISNCMQKDYLNFYCKNCGKNLCKEHYHNEYNCIELKNKNEENINYIQNNRNHITAKCTYCSKEIYHNLQCKCNLCLKDFCTTHRLGVDHNCPMKKTSQKDKYLDNKNKFQEKLNQLKNKKQ